MNNLKKLPNAPLPFSHVANCGEPPRNDGHWIWHPYLSTHAPAIVVFTRTFTLDAPLKTRIHISADQRFELAIDGAILARGPERGDHFHWAIHSYELSLEKGTHTLSVRCQWLGDMAPYAQMTSHAGFLLATDNDDDTLLSTKNSSWMVAHIKGVDFLPSKLTWGTGPCFSLNAENIPRDWTQPDDFDFVEAIPVDHAFFPHFVVPAELPEMANTPVSPPAVRFADNSMCQCPQNASAETPPFKINRDDFCLEEADVFANALKDNAPYTIPAHTDRTFLLDFSLYHCLYPTLHTKGGKNSVIQLHYAESLFADEKGVHKNNRNNIFDKYFIGIHDTCLPNGSPMRFDLPWWRAARYVLLTVHTTDAPLTLSSLTFHETHYPGENLLEFSCSNSSLKNFIAPSFRALQMCSHETYMDCPYYEQLMYVGDTRLEVLATFITMNDNRLPRKALKLLDWSRIPEGFTQSRYPSRTPQLIPPFSLWWVCMVHDYLMWRGDTVFIAERLPGIHAVTHAFAHYCDDDGLIRNLPGWNFIDWVPSWIGGMPPVPPEAANALINLQYILTLQAAEKVSRACGDEDNALLFAARAQRSIDAIQKTFWNSNKKAFAYHEDGTGFAQHTQCLAMCSGICTPEQEAAIAELLTSSDVLEKCTIYFSHYLFEALHLLRKTDAILSHLQPWHDACENGITTLPETPEPTRSDCHAWGAHILYHYVTKFLGVKPLKPGCSEISVTPRLQQFSHISGRVTLPQGMLKISANTEKGTASIELPENVVAHFSYKGIKNKLNTGKNMLSIE